jgi:small subunit ribosomal protein S16
MVRIRLRRVGAKKQPSYRVVVADSRSPRDGRFIERLGWYNPRTDPPSFKIEEGRALYWLSVGAQPSDAVARLLKKMGTFGKYERVKAGASMDEVLAEPAPVETPELVDDEPLPTEAEIAAEEPADEVDETDEADETDEVDEADETDEADEALEETRGEEEDEAA